MDNSLNDTCKQEYAKDSINTSGVDKEKKENKEKKKKKKNRCQHQGCKKKLAAYELAIKCVCGKSFCSNHRIKSKHNCSSNIINKDDFISKCGLGGGSFKQLEVI